MKNDRNEKYKNKYKLSLKTDYNKRKDKLPISRGKDKT